MKVCPFCGSGQLVVEVKPSAWDHTIEEVHVVCNDCAASAPSYVWDMRTAKKEPEKKKVQFRDFFWLDVMV